MPGTTESEEEKEGQNAQLTPSATNIQSFLQCLRTPERAEEEVGTATWVVLPVHLYQADTLRSLGSAQVVCSVFCCAC